MPNFSQLASSCECNFIISNSGHYGGFYSNSRGDHGSCQPKLVLWQDLGAVPVVSLKPYPGASPCSTSSPRARAPSCFAINASLEACPCHAQPLSTIRDLLKLACDAPEPSPRIYKACRPLLHLTHLSLASFGHQDRHISPEFASVLHGRLGLGLVPTKPSLLSSSYHVHLVLLVPLSLPTPFPPRRSRPFRRNTTTAAAPGLLWLRLSPPPHSSPAADVSPERRRLGLAHPPVASARPEVACAGRPLGRFLPCPLLCSTRGTEARGKKTTEARAPPAAGPHLDPLVMKIFTDWSLIFYTS
nr:uncharacterized protein LOC123493604 [Aegilops tauschii subsp. strangulata]XP_045083419.1 uncharacterized protein LOC123493605 [Aegilops tauschii subsp. strangulata]